MDRPRRSARQSMSGHQSPAPTSTPYGSSAAAIPSNMVPPAAMANGTSSSSRYQASSYASPAAYHNQLAHTPSGSGSSLIQAGSALLPQQQHMSSPHPSFPQPMPHDSQSASQLALQSLPNVYFLGRGSAPIAPGTSAAPPRPFGTAASTATIPQAMYSTFPARMKAGTTNLLQSMPQSEWYDPSGKPLDPLSTPGYASPHAATSYRSSRVSGRSRRAAAGFVRYAEAASSDDEFEEDMSRAGTEDDAASRGLKRGLEDEQHDTSKAYLALPPPASRMVAKRVFHRTNHVYHNHDDLERQAGRNEILVPIKIDLEAEQYRIKDSFTWNMNEQLISPHHFAKLLLEDLDIPVEPYATQIMNLINQQIEDATGVADIELEPAAGGIWASARLSGKQGELSWPLSEQSHYDPLEESTKEARSWNWGLERSDEQQRAWRKQMAQRLHTGQGLGDFEDDLRVIVDYEVQILRHMLRDRLEWDLCSPLTPESFASKLCDDLALSGEAQALIANSVREQLINHKRAALELGLAGSGRLIKQKQNEIQAAWAELHAEKLDKQRNKLDKGGTMSEPQSHVQSVDATREPSVQPSVAADDLGTSQDGGAKEEDIRASVEGAGGEQGEDDEEDAETLHLTATATAAPTREGTCTPAIQPRSSSLNIPATRSSARLSEKLSEASTASDATNTSQPKLSAAQRLDNASYTLREILSRGPRPLEAIWRDWHESREFGPLLERLSDDDLEKLEEANIRASRRNRREAARSFGGRRRR
ncbi:hypothetical protein NDA18_000219 [Ustilago nuda]|nr:hypothetical protein NDA18_000219 [Ustilago nuda]